MASKKESCPECRSIVVWLTPLNGDIVAKAQANFKGRGQSLPSKDRAINRIIAEWQTFKDAGK